MAAPTTDDELQAVLRLTTTAERVRRGAELLDEARPGWHREVRPGEIRMGSNEDCVLGQLYGHFQFGRKALGLSPAWPLGFDGTATEYGTGGYADLAACWRAEIEARLDADGEGEGVILG